MNLFMYRKRSLSQAQQIINSLLHSSICSNLSVTRQVRWTKKLPCLYITQNIAKIGLNRWPLFRRLLHIHVLKNRWTPFDIRLFITAIWTLCCLLFSKCKSCWLYLNYSKFTISSSWAISEYIRWQKELNPNIHAFWLTIERQFNVTVLHC
jgi:hypothetical protein